MTFNIFALRSLSKAIKAGEKARQSPETQHPRPVGDEGDALAAWHASQQEFKDQVASSAAIVEALKIVDLSVAVAATEVAETIQQAAALMLDRLNLLVGFLNRTDPPSADADAPRNFFARLLIKVGVPELGVLALEEGAKTGLEEIGKEVAAQFVPLSDQYSKSPSEFTKSASCSKSGGSTWSNSPNPVSVLARQTIC